MKIQCDACENAEASVFCCADEAALCNNCDSRVHQANKLASKHHRVSMGESHSSSAEAPRCDICQERTAFFFCQQDRAVLCRDCDFSVHSANALTAKHGRFLIPGIRVSLQALEIPGAPPASPASPQKQKAREKMAPRDGDPFGKLTVNSMSKTDPTTTTATTTTTASDLSGGTDNPRESSNPVNSTGSQELAVSVAGGMSGSTISEYFTQTLPGWHVEEFLGSDSPEPFEWSASEHGSSKLIINLGEDLEEFLDQDWTADLEFPRAGFYVEGEVPQMRSTPTASGMCRYGRFGVGLDDTFMVPDMAPAAPPSKRMRPF